MIIIIAIALYIYIIVYIYIERERAIQMLVSCYLLLLVCIVLFKRFRVMYVAEQGPQGSQGVLGGPYLGAPSLQAYMSLLSLMYISMFTIEMQYNSIYRLGGQAEGRVEPEVVIMLLWHFD